MRDGADFIASQLRDLLSGRHDLMRWHLPERWTFIDKVPRTGVGKFDKKLVHARNASGVYVVITRSD